MNALILTALKKAVSKKAKSPSKEGDPAFDDAAQELWDAIEAKDFSGFKTALKGTARLAAMSEDEAEEED